MDDFNDLSTYNGKTEHDIWVDYSNYECTGELEEIFEEPDI